MPFPKASSRKPTYFTGARSVVSDTKGKEAAGNVISETIDQVYSRRDSLFPYTKEMKDKNILSRL
jgi:hypothetical protein